ncbi:lipopolysaccharide assembly protein LapB [Treponema sp. OMZ 788]|uniref:tetratricopeptide repeat protein n=1 Tax=unclassified Treponema TaxID=2638727 RepID=UPI0020A3BB7D|nr:tetratricopeptide repeat protein [Treponema sp. OMZ 788]
MSCLSFFSCVSTKKSVTDESPIESIEQNGAGLKPIGEGTILSLPGKDELAEKRLDSALASLIEKGSPSSLKEAILFIQNDSKGLTAENKLYLKIIADIMYLAYPLETNGVKPPISAEDEPYLQALKEVKVGLYPISTKKDGFLGLIIPALVLTYDDFSDAILAPYSEDIESRLTAAQKLRPQSVLPYYLLGLFKEKNNKLTEAVALYQKAWQLDSSCYPAGFKYGHFAAESGNGAEALKIADTLNSLYSDNTEVKLLYARAHIAKNDFNKASENIVSVLKKEPENISALLLRIRILIEQKEYLKANSLLDAYATKNKTAKNYLLYRARLTREWNKNLIRSSEFLTEAYKYYPEDFNVLLACAEICFEASTKIDNKPADFFIRKVLEGYPENAAALALLVKNDINNGKWNQAAELAENLVGKYPVSANKELLLTSYLGAGQTAKALALAKQLYSNTKNPSNSFINLYLEALYAGKDYAAIRQLIGQKMKGADSELKSILYYYNAKLEQGNPAGYLNFLQSSLLSNPRNKDSLFAMYEWYLKNKDPKKAKYYLGQVLALDPSNKNIINLSENLDRLLAD